MDEKYQGLEDRRKQAIVKIMLAGGKNYIPMWELDLLINGD